MIQKLILHNFKSHRETALKFAPLTVLCGQNGVGKTSVVQSLLLLRQSFMKNRLQEGLDLNKPLCEIGNAIDAIYQYAQENHIKFTLHLDDHQHTWQFDIDDNNTKATFLNLAQPSQYKQSLSKYALFNNHFQYLSASRLSPRESYPKDDYEVEKQRQISIEKGQGELIAHFLHHYASTDVMPALHHHSSNFKDLLNQTTAWEREISANVNVKVMSLGKGYEIKYNFDVEGNTPTEDFKAENVGFGVTYALPLIVSILSATPKSLLIIENPEAHLHPYGQAKLAELMCKAAQAGIQLVIETHSDHIINGICVANKRNFISEDKINIYYLDRQNDSHACEAHLIKVTSGGRIQHPPMGFFDQFGKDLRVLMGR